MSNLPKPTIEFDTTGSRHRLMSACGTRHSHWASYREFTYLDGWVGATAYWLPQESVMTPQEFMACTAVKESNDATA